MNTKLHPIRNHKNNQCSYCNKKGHDAHGCPKLAKRRKLDEVSNVSQYTHCNVPGHEEQTSKHYGKPSTKIDPCCNTEETA